MRRKKKRPQTSSKDYSADLAGLSGLLGTFEIGGPSYWMGFSVVAHLENVRAEAGTDGVTNAGVLVDGNLPRSPGLGEAARDIKFSIKGIKES